jgi:tRNA dimethylallyltransferase
VEPDPRLRGILESLGEEKGIRWLHAGLERADHIAAKKIDPRNVRRTIRALEVILTTGKPFSQQRKQSDSPYKLLTIGLKRPREELYQRVDERIETMFKTGLLDEVQGLLAKGYSPELPPMSAIGYRECVQIVQGQMSAEQAKVEMMRATRVFVRRQGNWFKEDDPNIHWFYAGESNLADMVEDFIRRNV